MEYLKSIIPLPKGYLPKVTFAGQQWPVISFTLKMGKPGLRAKAKLVIILEIIEWIFFLALCVAGGALTYNAIQTYRTNETTLGTSLKPITKLPVITICNVYPVLFDIHFIYNYIHGTKDLVIGKETFIESENEYVKLEILTEHCLKLTSRVVDGKLKKTSNRVIEVRIKDKEENEDFGFSVFDVHDVSFGFVSEANYYGGFIEDWMDGKPFGVHSEQDEITIVKLEPEEYTYLQTEDESNCSEQTYLEQLKPHLVNANFSQCPSYCSPWLLPFQSDLPLCGWGSEYGDWHKRNCAREVLKDVMVNVNLKGMYSRPCHILQYSGEISAHKGLDHNDDYVAFGVRYQFTPPQMTVTYKEYLIFDTIGVVGAVGGTLGMVIGFSLTGVISNIIVFLKKIIKTKL